jgi:glycosyltransferase involved in cell wall biosynthesis
MLTILNVAYPLLPVSCNSCGGAEQILWQLEAAITQAGHRSLVIAAEGSRVTGTLFAVPAQSGYLSEETIAAAQAHHRTAIQAVLCTYPVDVVHMHGVDFDRYLPQAGAPVLVTLHCPPQWYAHAALKPRRARTYFNAVSARQHHLLAGVSGLLSPIENGVSVGIPAAPCTDRRYALVLGRIAPEKGIHIAIDAARAAHVPLVIAGEVHAYREHQRYYDTEIAPRLDDERRWIGSVGFHEKVELLAGARCLLVCSTVEETSSLAAREALAAGTPVVAFARGALPDTVDDGVTGWLVHNADQLPDAIRRASGIDPEVCRRTARSRFDARTMTAAYLQLYSSLARLPLAATQVEGGVA